MAAITIDSPRWREGWGEDVRHGAPAARPALQVVAGSGSRRPSTAVLRRRRLAATAVTVLLAVVVLAATSLLARPAAAGAPASGRITHVVQPGDTYWSIAAGLEHDGDLRVLVDRLVDANGGRALVAGDRVEVPLP